MMTDRHPLVGGHIVDWDARPDRLALCGFDVSRATSVAEPCGACAAADEQLVHPPTLWTTVRHAALVLYAVVAVAAAVAEVRDELIVRNWLCVAIAAPIALFILALGREYRADMAAENGDVA